MSALRNQLGFAKYAICASLPLVMIAALVIQHLDDSKTSFRKLTPVLEITILMVRHSMSMNALGWLRSTEEPAVGYFELDCTPRCCRAVAVVLSLKDRKKFGTARQNPGRGQSWGNQISNPLILFPTDSHSCGVVMLFKINVLWWNLVGPAGFEPATKAL